MRRNLLPPHRKPPFSGQMFCQSLLVAAVVLWVLDIPRRVFNVSFYTEQLLDDLPRPDTGTCVHRGYLPTAPLERLGRHGAFAQIMRLHRCTLCVAHRRGGNDPVERSDR